MDNPSSTPPGQSSPGSIPPQKKEDSVVPKPSEEVHAVTSPVDPGVIPPPVGKSSKYRYIWLVVIFGLVLSVVGVGAYIIDSESRKPPSQISALTTPTPVVSRPPATPTPDPKVNWKVYENTKYAYQIRYPSTVSLKEFAKSDYIEIRFASQPEYFSIQVLDLDVSVEEAMKTDKTRYKPWGADFIKETKLADYPAYYYATPSAYITIKMPDLQGKPFTSYEVYQADTNRKLSIHYFGDGDTKKLFEQILSTLTFIDSATPSGTMR